MPGHIQKRQKKYVLRLYMREREISRSFATEAEAKAAQGQLASHVLTHALQLGPYGDPNGRFGAYLRTWLARQRDIAPASLERAHDIVHRVCRDPIAALRYSRVTPRILEGYYDRLQADGLHPATIRRHHAVIRKALNDGLREEVLAKNPARLVKLPRAPKPEIEIWSEAQILLFLSEKSRFNPVYTFAATTVSRQGEILGLPWSRVDLDRAEVRFTQALHHRRGGGWILKQPKTRASCRPHPLTPAMVAMLREVRAGQERAKAQRPPCVHGLSCRKKSCRAWHDAGLVFTLDNGKAIHKRNLIRDLHEVCDRLKLPSNSTFHAMRHFAATHLLANGVPARDVMELGGWTSAAFFISTYAHSTSQGQEKAVAVMSKIHPVTLPSKSEGANR